MRQPKNPLCTILIQSNDTYLMNQFIYQSYILTKKHKKVIHLTVWNTKTQSQKVTVKLQSNQWNSKNMFGKKEVCLLIEENSCIEWSKRRELYLEGYPKWSNRFKKIKNLSFKVMAVLNNHNAFIDEAFKIYRKFDWIYLL